MAVEGCQTLMGDNIFNKKKKFRPLKNILPQMSGLLSKADACPQELFCGVRE